MSNSQGVSGENTGNNDNDQIAMGVPNSMNSMNTMVLPAQPQVEMITMAAYEGDSGAGGDGDGAGGGGNMEGNDYVVTGGYIE